MRATIALLIWLLPSAAFAQTKIALLIGNQAYDASVGMLKNSHNDIAIVGEALRAQNFDVLPPIKDASRSTILGGVRELVRRLNEAPGGSIGFVYYSGHGAAEKGTNINYLIPVNAKQPGTDAFWDDSLKLDDVLRLLDGARSAAKFVVFDACRNELRLPTKDTSKGLLPVTEQEGLFVAYASSPGRTATDRGDKSGVYAAALAAELQRPGLDHLNLFQNVKEAVLTSTAGVQQPWESNGLSRRVYLTEQQKLPDGRGSTLVEAAEAWDRIKDTKDLGILEAFAQRYKDALYAELARSRIEALQRQTALRQTEGRTESLPKGQFDGVWYLDRASKNCGLKSWRLHIMVQDGVVAGVMGAGAVSGTISESGQFALKHPGMTSGQPDGSTLHYRGSLQGSSGSGTFYQNPNCDGTFTLQRPAATPGHSPQAGAAKAADERAKTDVAAKGQAEKKARTNPQRVMTFFVTSSGNGKGANLGGLAGADRHCQELAQAVGAGDITWRAYLSVSAVGGAAAVNARDRIGRGPWRNPKGVVIAKDLDDLHGPGNMLSKQTALNEKGEIVRGRFDTPNEHDILTGSLPDGHAFPPGDKDMTCGNWTKSGVGSAVVGHNDRTGGLENDASKSWNSSHGTLGCAPDALRGTGGNGLFYCFAAN